MEGKEVKWDKKELDIELDCRKKVKYFLIILIWDCVKIVLYIFLDLGEDKGY